MLLQRLTLDAFIEHRRIIAPMAGFPALRLIGKQIREAQENSEIHYEAILKLVEILKPDIVFPMMDLSLEVGALGRIVEYPLDLPPFVPECNFNFEELHILEKTDIFKSPRLLTYLKTIQNLNSHLPGNVLRGAHITGPFTLATLIVGIKRMREIVEGDKTELHKLITVTTSIQRTVIEEFINSGVKVMNILEPMSVFLSEENFYELSGIYLRSLIQFIHSMLTDCVLHICGNSSHLIREMCKTEADALSLDSPEAGVDLLQIASTIHEEIVFWGNLNPLGSLLNGSPDDVSADTSDLLVRMQKIPNFILSTGCDLPYDIPIENLASFMKTGREFSNW